MIQKNHFSPHSVQEISCVENLMQSLIYCLCDNHVLVLFSWLQNLDKISKRLYQHIKK